jgi:hypothetical protein
MNRVILIGIAAIVMSLAASCGGGSSAPAPQPEDTTGPAITITGVEDGQTVGGDVNITAAAADPAGVVDFDFEVNGNNVATESDGSMSFTWNTAGNGTDTLKFTARDAEGNASTVEMEVTRWNGIDWPDLPLGPAIDWGDIFDFGL